MNKRWMIILVAVSMLLFGSVTFAGDGQSTSQNSPANAGMLASNSQESPQVVNEAMENFRVEQEEMGQDMLFAQMSCEDICEFFAADCFYASPGQPFPAICQAICNTCVGEDACDFCSAPQ